MRFVLHLRFLQGAARKRQKMVLFVITHRRKKLAFEFRAILINFDKNWYFGRKKHFCNDCIVADAPIADACLDICQNYFRF